jgi:predicted aspartyl protease
MKNYIIILVLITVLISCTTQQKKSVIPIKVDRNRTHVTVKVGDVMVPDILIDTGFAFDGLMIYNPDYKDSLDLTNTVEVRIGGAGSGEASIAFMLDSVEFSLGDLKIKNQRVFVLKSDTYKGFPSNGLIGYSIFGHYITEFDYDDNTLSLYEGDSIEVENSWSVIPLYFKGNNIPWVDVSIVIEDEKPIPISTYIDYASGDPVILLEKPDQKFVLPSETENVHIGRGLSGDIYGKTGYISKLIIGSYELENVNTSFALAKVRSKQENADGILGNGSLRRFNLIFDYANKELYIKPNTHFNEPFN